MDPSVDLSIFKRYMDRSNTKNWKYYVNAYQQIPVPYGSMLHITLTNLATKQEPHKKAYILMKNLGRLSNRDI